MITEKENKYISKFLSFILRHKPETIGITLDTNGWAEVTELLEKLVQGGKGISFDILKHVVDTNAKKRFAFNEDFSLIRASQGHSIAIDSGYEPQQPPKILYHGTAQKNRASILQNGLLKGTRLHVHLSTDTDTAVKVGQRHGKPLVLEVAALQMYNEGFVFYLSDNEVWLTDNVPSSYINIQEEGSL